jgi:hypothetical protein
VETNDVSVSAALVGFDDCTNLGGVAPKSHQPAAIAHPQKGSLRVWMYLSNGNVFSSTRVGASC